MKSISIALFLISTSALALDTPLSLETVKTYVETGAVNSVDELVGQLPASLRQNPLFMIHSRSLQSATFEFPRVILKGYDSQFLVAFGTDPNGAGYKTVEMIEWNEEKKTFLFGYVDFSSGKPLVYSDQTSRQIKRCANCHTPSLRPNWDTYNFWAGLVPFNKDTLVKGSKETEIYMGIVTKMKSGHDRLRHLMLPTEVMDGSLFDKSPRYTLPNYTDGKGSTTNEGPGVALFDELSVFNHRRLARVLSENALFPKIRFAALGAASGCNIDGFLPEKYLANAVSYFGTDLSGVVKMTGESQDQLYTDKIDRQKAILPESDISRLENQETSLGEAASLRWVLEPFGVKMNQWSLSIDPGTYTFGDLLGRLGPELYFYFDRYMDCEELKRRSLEQLIKP